MTDIGAHLPLAGAVWTLAAPEKKERKKAMDCSLWREEIFSLVATC